MKTFNRIIHAWRVVLKLEEPPSETGLDYGNSTQNRLRHTTVKES